MSMYIGGICMSMANVLTLGIIGMYEYVYECVCIDLRDNWYQYGLAKKVQILYRYACE